MNSRLKLIVILFSFLGCLGLTAQEQVRDTNILTTVFNATWFPDGKSVLVTAAQFDRLRRNLPRFDLYKLQLEPYSLDVLINNASDGIVSPDGKMIAICRPGARPMENDIYLYNLGNKQLTPLLTDTINEASPSWSPDGKKIVYNTRIKRGPAAPVYLNVIDVATKQSIRISNNEYKNYNPVWSSDGNHIVYYLETGDDHDQIFLTDDKGSFHRNLTNDPTTHNYYPSWVDNKIIYSMRGEQLSSIDKEGKNKKVYLAKPVARAFYNSKVNRLLYIATNLQQPEIHIYDLKSGKDELVLSTSQVQNLFK